VILDAHMHIGDFPLFGLQLDGDGLLELMAECGIDGGLVFSPDNQAVFALAGSAPGIWGLVWANPRVASSLAETAALLAHERCVGIKLHPLLDAYLPDDPIVHPFYELALERDVPVLVHTGHPIFTLPWSFEDVAVRYPALKLVLGHMGHGNVVYVNAAIAIAERRPNVYLETSGMPMHTKIREAVDRVGADRVLFGSDVPFHHPAVEVLKVRVSGLGSDLVARVLGTNAAALFLRDEAALS
jgi:predicted TIM-barrel fold metal-dependent hydrolase